MNNKSPLPRGFSLLEVLIAIAILAFGLLAITSLQASLVRSSSEAKARSTALSLAKDRLEEFRSFGSIDEYKALTDQAQASAGSLGGVAYTVETEVLRYGYDGTANAFELLASDTAEPAAEYVDENEFKRVKVTVGWTDVTGQTQTVVLQDAIGAVPPENTGKLARRSLPAAERRPEILITNPASDPGVIPIAIGDGSETAATNPRPEVATGVELQTSYDIFTYAALNNSTNAKAQSRVETAVIGCTCDFGEKNTDQVAYRPIVWDGTRYVAPDPAGYTPIAGEAKLNGKESQSVLCNACCRDHHDPTGSQAPLFSPRLEEHEHYAADDLTTPVSSDEYIEACRMIRVDGIFRVAADPYNEYTNLLKTGIKSGESDYFTDFRPDGDAADDYVDFVIEYLESQMAQSDPNAQIAQADADTMAAGLDDPAEVIESTDKRWVHARGLYIDYLEDDAKEAIAESAGCSDTLSDSECLLRVLPFTSINVTELAFWSPTSGESSAIVMENNLFRDTLNFDEPVRGQVTGLSAGSANATAVIRTSNTGLLAQENYVISPWDLVDTDPDAIPDQENNVDDQPDADAQTFTIQAPECGVVGTDTTIEAKAVVDLTTQPTCPAADTSKPLLGTMVKLTLSPTSGPTTVKIELISPDGKVYTVVPTGTAFSSLNSTYEFEALSQPDLGAYTLRVTSEDNGKDDVLNLGFNVEYLYTAKFTVALSGYTFTTLTQPSGALSTGGSCSFSNSVNPTTCATTQPGVAHTVTLGTYNYTGTKANTSVTCTKSNGNALSCPNVTATTCRNFNVDSATNAPFGGGTAIAGTLGTVSNAGKIAESTPITFTSVGSGDVISVVMTETTPATIATCAAQACNNITWTCP